MSAEQEAEKKKKKKKKKEDNVAWAGFQSAGAKIPPSSFIFCNGILDQATGEYSLLKKKVEKVKKK